MSNSLLVTVAVGMNSSFRSVVPDKYREKKNALRGRIRCDKGVNGAKADFVSTCVPDCPEPGVFGFLMIPLAAICCFIAGVPLGKGSMGMMKLRTSGNGDGSDVDLHIGVAP
jgi:hypothetical protein